jgi:4-amino-4-deoxy-L-arabinose transferase-like glycosyltransferase
MLSPTSSRSSLLSPLSILVLAGIASKIFLLNWFRGEYTDGIIQLQLFENRNTFFPPLFPLLAEWAQTITRDPILAGRLVSLLASALTLIPLYHLARRLFGPRAAWWAGWLYLACAVVNRWALRVMTDSLFTFFFLTALFTFIRSMESVSAAPIANLPAKLSLEFDLALGRAKNRRWLYLMIAATGLATLTRYQGLALLPLIAVAAARNRKGYTRWELLETAFSLLPWAALLYWMRVRGFGHTAQFAGRVHGTLGQTLLAYWDMAETYILYFPYALTLPVFVLFMAGVLEKGLSEPARIARWTLAYLFVLWLLVHAAFQSFQYRYFLPLIPPMLIFAGRGMVLLLEAFERRKWKAGPVAASLIVALSLGFSAAVIYLQRNAFADLADVGQLIAGQNLKGGRILAAEVYNEGNTNIKLAFWARQPILFCEPMEQFAFQPGDYVVLSNYYNDFERAARILQSRYEFEVVYQTPRYTLRPLLPDIMTYPPRCTSQPLCMAYRFHQQVYYCNVIRILGPKK